MQNPAYLKLQQAGLLTADDQQLVDQLTHGSRVYEKGVDLIREGEWSRDILVVLSGMACKYKQLDAGTAQIVAIMVPGDICDAREGLLQRIDHSIMTLSKCEVSRISPSQLDAGLAIAPHLATAMQWSALVDVSILRQSLANAVGRIATVRLAHLICELRVRLLNVGFSDGVSFALLLSQEQISNVIGITPVHVNRVLKNLRDEAVVSISRGVLHILNLNRLEAIAGFDPSYLHLTGVRRS